MSEFHATTIFAIQHNGECSMAGDGQVTFGNAVVMNHVGEVDLDGAYFDHTSVRSLLLAALSEWAKQGLI